MNSYLQINSQKKKSFVKKWLKADNEIQFLQSSVIFVFNLLFNYEIIKTNNHLHMGKL